MARPTETAAADDLKRELMFLLPTSAIEGTGRLTLEKESLAHLGFQPEEPGDAFVLCLDDRVEVWHPSYYDAFRARMARTYDLQGLLRRALAAS